MTRNLAESIRARLATRARENGRPFQEILQFFALERFLFRLAESHYSTRFVLKGGLLLRVWDAPITRPTRDIDLLAKGDDTIEAMVAIFREICGSDVDPDGLIFRADTVRGTTIKEGAAYEGVRIELDALLGSARIRVQIDLGFGDVVHPPPTEVSYPSSLDFEAPRLRAYPREAMIAEKFQVMVDLGLVNSRMKDFYDIWLLARQFDFVGAVLRESISKTFAHRGTLMPPVPMCLSPAFWEDRDKQVQWRAFRVKGGLEASPQRLEELILSIEPFRGPLAGAVANDSPFARTWTAPGPWI